MKKSILPGKTDLLKLSRDILEKGKFVRFQARGWSMRPFIQDGDYITVSPVESSSFKIGNVVLYFTFGDKVIVHRIIKKYKKEGRMTLLVKGDATSGFADKVDVQNVLGTVIAVERNGHQRRIDTPLYRIIGLLFAGISPCSQWIYPIGSIVKHKGRRLFGGILEKIQSLKLYSILVKRLMKADINYQLADPDDIPVLSRLYRYSQELGLENSTDALHKKQKNSGTSEYWLVARRKDRIIAAVILTKFLARNYPYVGWWLFGMKVNWRYRRMGIALKLTQMATEVASKHGAPEIKLLVFEDAKPAYKLYQKLGFSQISIPELDRLLEEEARKTLRRRIILAKDLKSS